MGGERGGRGSRGRRIVMLDGRRETGCTIKETLYILHPACRLMELDSKLSGWVGRLLVNEACFFLHATTLVGEIMRSPCCIFRRDDVYFTLHLHR